MIIDIVVAAIVLISALISFLRGFIRESLTIMGVVGGILAAVFFGGVLTPVIRDLLGANVEDPPKLFDVIPMTIIADGLSYGSIFIVVVISLSVVSHVTADAAQDMGLGPVDRTLGVVFGIVRAVVLLGLLYLPFHLLMEKDTKDSIFEGSKTYIFIEQAADLMAGFLPESENTEKTVKKVEKKSGDTIREKLLDQDLLRTGNKEDEKAKEESGKNDKSSTGYDQKERNQMDDLFKTRELNE